MSTRAQTHPGRQHALRFQARHAHLASPFGADWFGRRAEAFARFFGTPRFLLVQTGIVSGWILANAVSLIHFDPYPFILLNLAFSLQAAYAAPLILLAETRQADRDKAHAEADAEHREALATESARREELLRAQAEALRRLLEQNTRLTAEIDRLTREIRDSVVTWPKPAGHADESRRTPPPTAIV
jgi:uncharacterized membrane protein